MSGCWVGYGLSCCRKCGNSFARKQERLWDCAGTSASELLLFSKSNRCRYLSRETQGCFSLLHKHLPFFPLKLVVLFEVEEKSCRGVKDTVYKKSQVCASMWTAFGRGPIHHHHPMFADHRVKKCVTSLRFLRCGSIVLFRFSLRLLSIGIGTPTIISWHFIRPPKQL